MEIVISQFYLGICIVHLCIPYAKWHTVGLLAVSQSPASCHNPLSRNHGIPCEVHVAYQQQTSDGKSPPLV
ncbi:MAG: hypothetical protein PHR18_06950 [Oscillospiraceae bacterium]|nr:hypothetical protein [Oscillospiraceae bacterium]